MPSPSSLLTSLWLAMSAVVLTVAAVVGDAYGLTKEGTDITYDRRSLMVGRRKDIFFSDSIHYPRSPPHAWPDLIARAKEGGLNIIESYVYWKGHEPEMGVYNFEERYDMVKFFNLVQQHDMFAMVKIGPFVQAE